MIRLYLLRHGEAQRQASTDADRALTSAGRADVEKVASALVDEGVEIEQIWASPYRRAMESAEIVNEALERGVDPVVTDLLTPEADIDALAGQLAACDAESLMLVTHMPLVGELLHWLTGDEPGRHPMGTASLACLDAEMVAADMARLRWLRHREAE